MEDLSIIIYLDDIFITTGKLLKFWTYYLTYCHHNSPEIGWLFNDILFAGVTWSSPLSNNLRDMVQIKYGACILMIMNQIFIT